jgi:hypothetical protein
LPPFDHDRLRISVLPTVSRRRPRAYAELCHHGVKVNRPEKRPRVAHIALFADAARLFDHLVGAGE